MTRYWLNWSDGRTTHASQHDTAEDADRARRKAKSRGAHYALVFEVEEREAS